MKSIVNFSIDYRILFLRTWALLGISTPHLWLKKIQSQYLHALSCHFTLAVSCQWNFLTFCNVKILRFHAVICTHEITCFLIIITCHHHPQGKKKFSRWRWMNIWKKSAFHFHFLTLPHDMNHFAECCCNLPLFIISIFLSCAISVNLILPYHLSFVFKISVNQPSVLSSFLIFNKWRILCLLFYIPCTNFIFPIWSYRKVPWTLYFLAVNSNEIIANVGHQELSIWAYIHEWLLAAS